MKFLLLICLLMFALSAVHGQSMADSATQWQVFQHEEYEPFDAAKDAGVKSIYIVMNLDAYSNDYLYIESRLHPSIFVNGKLFVALSGEALKIALDSIKTFAHTSQVQIGIFQSTINPGTLQAELVSATKHAELNNVVSRPPSYFRDFVILASMFLLILLVVIIYASPKLASDYLSITKLFTAHDSDDMQSGVRSVNISSVLFYLLLALMFSLFFKIVFHFAEPRITVAWYFNGMSVAGEVWQWLKLSGFVLLFFIVKGAWVYTVSRVFDIQEIARVQLYNWIKITLLLMSLVLVLTVFYFFMVGINADVYMLFFKIAGALLIGLVLMIFSKVARKTSFSMFHIFSYLCATEIIPLLISIKLIYH